MATTNETEVTGAKRGENEAVLVRMSEPSEEGRLFRKERCFFLPAPFTPWNQKVIPLGPAPLCPVKFTVVRGNAHFTGVAPGDGTGVECLPCGIPAFRRDPFGDSTGRAYSSGVREEQKKITLRALCDFAVNYYEKMSSP